MQDAGGLYEFTVVADWEMECDQGGQVIFAEPHQRLAVGLERRSDAFYVTCVRGTSGGADRALHFLSTMSSTLRFLRVKLERKDAGDVLPGISYRGCSTGDFLQGMFYRGFPTGDVLPGISYRGFSTGDFLQGMFYRGFPTGDVLPGISYRGCSTGDFLRGI